MTAKSVIACMSMPEFQKTEKLRKILSSPNLKDSKLAALLKIYNDSYVRKQMDINRKEFSALSVLIREFSSRGSTLN